MGAAAKGREVRAGARAVAAQARVEAPRARAEEAKAAELTGAEGMVEMAQAVGMAALAVVRPVVEQPVTARLVAVAAPAASLWAPQVGGAAVEAWVVVWTEVAEQAAVAKAVVGRVVALRVVEVRVVAVKVAKVVAMAPGPSTAKGDLMQNIASCAPAVMK